MKRWVFILGLFLLFVSAQQQAHALGDKERYLLGIHIDPLISWISSDNSRFRGATANVGLNVGVELEFKFAQRYSFLTGAAIDLRGAGIKYLERGYHITTRYDGKLPVEKGKSLDTRVRAFSVPLALNMRAIQVGYSTFFATAGLQLSIPFYEEAALDAKKYRTSGMYTPILLNYMIRTGIEYSLGGRSSIQAGLYFDGSILNVYRTGYGATDLYTLGLRVGFIF